MIWLAALRRPTQLDMQRGGSTLTSEHWPLCGAELGMRLADSNGLNWRVCDWQNLWLRYFSDNLLEFVVRILCVVCLFEAVAYTEEDYVSLRDHAA